MQLRRLILKDYQVLKDLEINFDPGDPGRSPFAPRTYGLSFLVGPNGTGKSTVMHALLDLFRQLDGGNRVDFGFHVEYQLWDSRARKAIPVSISNLSNPEQPAVMRRGDTETSWDTTLLPDRVIWYTTGRESVGLTPEKERTLQRHQAPLTPENSRQRFETETWLPPQPVEEEGEQQEERRRQRVKVVRNSRLPLVLVSGWLTALVDPRRDKNERRFSDRLSSVFSEAGVKRIAGFSLQLHVRWERLELKEREFVNSLMKAADWVVGHGYDRVLTFNLSENPSQRARDIFSLFAGGFEFFDALDRLSDPVAQEAGATLREVNVFLERLDVTAESGGEAGPASAPMLHLLDWLSDGERSFLSRMALLALLGTDNTLVLVDEPEVHFNDYWKRQIIHLLHASMQGRHSHVFIATHSSIALTDVHRRDVRVLERNGAYTSIAEEPLIETFAADPSDIMVHVFQAPQAIGEYSLSEMRQLLAENVDEEQLNLALAEVGQGYWSYRIRQRLLGRRVR